MDESKIDEIVNNVIEELKDKRSGLIRKNRTLWTRNNTNGDEKKDYVEQLLSLPQEDLEKAYNKMSKVDNIKQIMFDALGSGMWGRRGRTARRIFENNPSAFVSPKETEEMLTPERIRELKIAPSVVEALIITSGNIEKYLTPNIIEASGMFPNTVYKLIQESGNIERFLTPEIIKSSIMSGDEVVDLIEKTENIEKYLTPETIKAFGIDGRGVANLISQNGNIEKYLTPEKIKSFGIDGSDVAGLISQSGNIERFLTPEIIKSSGMSEKEVIDLIQKTGNIEKYLTLETIKAFGIDGKGVAIIISQSGNIEKYLTPETIKAFGIDGSDVAGLISYSGNIEKYLTPETIKSLGIDGRSVAYLISRSGNIEKYLTPEIIKASHMSGRDLTNVIVQTGNIERYLTPEYGLRGTEISILLLGNIENRFVQFIDEALDSGELDYQRIIKIGKTIAELKESNSGTIKRIANELAMQITTLPEEQQSSVISKIRKIYETNALPEFAQNFLVFKQLHPNLLDDVENKMYDDRSRGNIPSLNEASTIEKNRIIFSDLFRINIESNNRNIRDWLNTIETGDKLFNLAKENNWNLENKLTKEQQITLKKYCEILNSLYNNSSRGKSKGLRENTGNLKQDLEELNHLLSEVGITQKSLPDRITRMLGYWVGIGSFDEIKNTIEEKTKVADERNRNFAKKGIFDVDIGDFAKGIANTEYFPQMLQNGIVAKDYLGENSQSDCTPLDMDVELIKDKNTILTAKDYSSANVEGRALGTIILIIKNNGDFIKTREGNLVDPDAVEKVLTDKTKKEYFDNNGLGGTNASGIRTGIGSTNISFIISDRYVDKLGLEIARNGFYIPIVDGDRQLVFTPEMYDELRSKMQGMSYYGVSEFKLDESAKNEGTSKIIDLIEQNNEEVSQKRQKILNTINGAIEKCGLKMSDTRTRDLTKGIVEIIDTGSTGRGTNEPGQGDFDFMVRLDSNVLREPAQIKQALKEALSKVDKPQEADMTAKGDMRYKGVSIEGIDEKVDIDLSFVQRTNEVEYSTEECILDRLNTIKSHSEEDYKYAIANILLAKSVLKEEGAYKRKNAAPPEVGKKDTRGGMGAVGIENWVLQNGGSFEKAARNFLSVAQTCNNLAEFQGKYAVWDFGENYMSGEYYPHDNFVYNMNEEGYNRTKSALEGYLKAISIENNQKSSQPKPKISIAQIVKQDMEPLKDTVYFKSVEKMINGAKLRSNEQKQVKPEGEQIDDR